MIHRLELCGVFPRTPAGALFWYDDDTRAGTAKAAYLIDNILETGLEPFREPPTLAPIRLDEIELVCWMAISPT